MQDFHEQKLRSYFTYKPEEWVYCSFRNEYHEINTFDDGNQKFIGLENKWVVFGKWRGKLALYNLIDSSQVISSISIWKVNNAKKIEKNKDCDMKLP